MSAQLDVILSAVARVQEVAVGDIPPTSHAVPLTNVLRRDEAQPSLGAERALAAAPASEESRFRVPQILGDDSDRRPRPADGGGAAARIGSGDVSAVEVAQAHLDRIAAVDDKVHAFLHVDADGALAQARRVDSGELRGPLAGVPLALKDVIVTAGVPTTAGSRILEGWCRRTTRPSSSGCAPRASWSSARPTWTSSRWVPRRSTPPTARRTTRGT